MSGSLGWEGVPGVGPETPAQPHMTATVRPKLGSHLLSLFLLARLVKQPATKVSRVAVDNKGEHQELYQKAEPGRQEGERTREAGFGRHVLNKDEGRWKSWSR